MNSRLAKLGFSIVIYIYDMFVAWSGRESKLGSCVVINYHSISPETKLRFAKQLDILLCLARPIAIGKELKPEKGRRFVAITVDDVFGSFVANGLPELCRRNMPVMLFPPVGYLGRKSSWNDYGGENKVGEAVASADELRQIVKLGNVSFGSHGVMHADLTLLSETEAKQELQDSKKLLEEIVGHEITAFSFPYGSHGARELRLAGEAGYKFVFDSTPQQIFATSQGGLIGRVDVQPTDWNIEFRLKICGAYRWVRWASAWKKKIRSGLGSSTPAKIQSHG